MNCVITINKHSNCKNANFNKAKTVLINLIIGIRDGILRRSAIFLMFHSSNFDMQIKMQIMKYLVH